MTEQQEHLSQAVEQQKNLIREVNELSEQLNMKREMALKLQGIIEYLQQTGVTLPETFDGEDVETSEEVSS